MLKPITLLTILLSASSATFVGCATAPKTVEEQQSLETRAGATLRDMTARDAGLQDLLDHSAGYAVFPDIGKAGFWVGAAWGRGILYQNGKFAGFVQLSQGSFGAQIGAQSMAELIVFQDLNALERLKAGTFELGADASAVALTTGAAASARFNSGVAVFAMPRGGAMVELTVSGQKISYQAG